MISSPSGDTLPRVQEQGSPFMGQPSICSKMMGSCSSLTGRPNPVTKMGLITSWHHPESKKALTRMEVLFWGLYRVIGIINKDLMVLTRCGALSSGTCLRVPPGEGLTRFLTAGVLP